MDNQDRSTKTDEADDGIEIELDWSDLRSPIPDAPPEESEERITVPPPVPTDQYAAELMATAEGSWTDLPPQGGNVAPTPPPPSSRGGRFAHEGFDSGPESGLRPPSPRGFGDDPAGRQEDAALLADEGAIHEVRGRFALGDYSGALVMAESILDSAPTHQEARQYAEKCRDALAELYVSRLGGMERIPQVAVPADQLQWLSLDHRAGFLLSLMDGMSSIEDILDMSGMSNLEALRTMFELMQQDVIHVA